MTKLSVSFFTLLFLFVGPVSAEPSLTLTSPQDYQVFQRQTAKQGAVQVTGHAVEATAVQVRLADGDWKSFPVDAKTGDFRATLPTPAGGWYVLEARVMSDDKAVAQASVEHVGVGEVFIVAGQSNSTNYGSEKQKPASGKVSRFDGKHWAVANDPQRGADGNGGSFMPPFGDAMVARFDVPVAVVPCGVGATSVRQWLPKGSIMTNEPTIGSLVKKVGPGKWEATGQLFDGLTQRMDALGSHGFRAILWHQGESDAGQARGGYPAEKQITGKQYQDFMELLIKASREHAGWDVPWFVAQATYHSEKDSHDEEFRAAQKALWDNGTALQGPDTDALGKEYRAGVHMNGKGLREHGRLWAEKVGDWLANSFEPGVHAGKR